MRELRPWRAAVVLAACGVVAAVAPPAFAAETVKIRFEFGPDRESWFWQHQRDEQVEPPVDAPPPAPSLNQRQRIPTSRPVPEDSLAVEVFRGEHQMISALAFDVSTRGVTLGSEITKFVLFLEESTNRQEMTSIRADVAEIEACRIIESWPARYNDPRGPDAQLWQDQPAYDDSACVPGERDAQEGTAPIWTFDLTELAQPWGDNPFDNQGVMLVSALPDEPGPAETWHVQFKIPARDRAATPENEYQMSRDRLLVDLAFVPGEPEEILPPPPPPPPLQQPSGPTVPSSTTFGSTGSETDLDTAAPPTTTETEGPAEVAAPVATTQPAGPQMPGYVWALLPLGLLALAAVRSVVLEPAGGTRPDGVIAAIRRRNAQRRGAPLREAGDPLSGAAAAAARALKRTGRAASRTAAKLTRSVLRR